MNITITRLQNHDMAVAQESVAQFWKHRPDTERLAQFLHDQRHILLTALCEHAIVGQAIGYVLERWDGTPSMLLLYSIDVLESYRRQGIGRALLQRMREIGQQEGCGEMFLITNASNVPAMHFYQRSGGHRPFDDDVMFEFFLSQNDHG